jgi:hypothetical protein
MRVAVEQMATATTIWAAPAERTEQERSVERRWI